MRHLFAADTTIEELANNLKDNRKGILLFRDELSAWVRSMDMYRGKGTDRQFFLSAWSGEMVKVDRKMHHGQPIIVPHPSICVLGGIQPDLLSELEAEGGREDGFIHRVLFSYPDESPIPGWIEAVISNEESMEWHIVLSRLLNLQLLKVEGASERPRFLDFNPQGRQAFIEWFNRQASGMNAEDFPQELVGPCSKMRAYCARFALVLHMLRVACGETGSDQNEGQVDGDDVARAVKLCNYFTAHYRAVIQCLNQTSEDKQVEEFIGWLTRKCLSQTTVREMCRANVCGIKTASEAEKLLVAAVERGYGRWQDGAEWTPGGRKKARVPPFVFSR
jgi:hypothetical protein